MINFCRFLCISLLYLWTLQIPFVVHNTTHVSYIIVTKFIRGWCQAMCSKLRCQMLGFPLCLPNIPNIWPVVYMGVIIIQLHQRNIQYMYSWIHIVINLRDNSFTSLTFITICHLTRYPRSRHWDCCVANHQHR